MMSRPPKVGRSLDDPLRPAGFHQVFADRNGLAACFADFLGDDGSGALPLGVRSKVAHHDLGAFAGQRQRFAPADAASAAGDDCNLSRESTVVHFDVSSYGFESLPARCMHGREEQGPACAPASSRRNDALAGPVNRYVDERADGRMVSAEPAASSQSPLGIAWRHGREAAGVWSGHQKIT
jgi:hypothetical protein